MPLGKTEFNFSEDFLAANVFCLRIAIYMFKLLLSELNNIIIHFRGVNKVILVITHCCEDTTMAKAFCSSNSDRRGSGTESYW